MKRMGLLTIAGLIMTAALLTAAGVLEAGVAVTPERHIVVIAKGETKEVEYQVYNSGPQDIDIKLEPEDWTRIEAAKKIKLEEWLLLETKQMHVKVEETKPFKVIAKAPEGAEGEVLAMIFLSYKEDKNSILNIRNGNPLYVVIKGTERYGAEISAIKAGYRKDPVDLSDYIGVDVEVANTGNIHITPEIEVLVKDAKGKILKRLSLERSRILLRTEKYVFGLKWGYPGDISDGRYTLEANLKYEDRIKDVKGVAEAEIKGKDIKMLKQEKDR